MKEFHFGWGKPEPGFEKRLAEAVDRYFVQVPKTQYVVFQTGLIYREYPDLQNLDTFMERIREAANQQYDRRLPSR